MPARPGTELAAAAAAVAEVPVAAVDRLQATAAPVALAGPAGPGSTVWLAVRRRAPTAETPRPAATVVRAARVEMLGLHLELAVLVDSAATLGPPVWGALAARVCQERLAVR